MAQWLQNHIFCYWNFLIANFALFSICRPNFCQHCNLRRNVADIKKHVLQCLIFSKSESCAKYADWNTKTIILLLVGMSNIHTHCHTTLGLIFWSWVLERSIEREKKSFCRYQNFAWFCYIFDFKLSMWYN